MYGCFDALVIFGFNEGDRESMLSSDWLEEHYPGVQTFALDVVRNHAGEMAYGIGAELDRETGQVKVSSEDKKLIQELFHKLQESRKSEARSLGYFVVLSGDYESEHVPYDLEE